MMVRRTLEGAVKCALRDFLLEEWRAGGIYISTLHVCRGPRRTGIDLRHRGGGCRELLVVLMCIKNCAMGFQANLQGGG